MEFQQERWEGGMNGMKGRWMDGRKDMMEGGREQGKMDGRKQGMKERLNCISRKLNLCLCMCSGAQLCPKFFATPWILAHQVSLSMEFSKQEYWSRLPLPTLSDLQCIKKQTSV